MNQRSCSAAPMSITAPYKEENTVVQMCRQAPCHPPPPNAVSSEAWAPHEIALIQQAPSSQLSSELAVHTSSRGILPWLSQQPPSTHTSPAAPSTGLLDLWHTTSSSQLSFPQCILNGRQCFNKAICKTDVLKKSHYYKETARGQGEEETACGAVCMSRPWSSQSLTDLELWQWLTGGAGRWWERRAAMGYLIKLKLSWFSHRPPTPMNNSALTGSPKANRTQTNNLIIQLACVNVSVQDSHPPFPCSLIWDR